MSKAISGKRSDAELDAELARCFERDDLKPIEIDGGGFSLEHHYRATVASGPIPNVDWGLPLPRPTGLEPKPNPPKAEPV